MRSELENPRGRDLRIDFLRGVALIIVLVDHIEGINGVSFVRSWTPRSLGFSDAADAFVLLSGYTFGMVYGRRVERAGLLPCLRRSASRSIQIYLAYLVTLTAVLVLALVLRPAFPIVYMRLAPGDSIASYMLGGLLLSNHPYAFSILPFYVLILPYATVLVRLRQTRPRLAWTASLGLYLWSQCQPDFNLNRFPGSTPWHFNPFAWQFLYFIGIALATRPAGAVVAAPLKPVLGVIAVVVVAAGLIHLKGTDLYSGPATQLVSQSLDEMHLLTRKSSLGVLRVLHILSVAWLVSLVLAGRHIGRNGAVTCLPVFSGRHSLAFYSFGIILTYCSIPVLTLIGTSVAALLIIHFDAVSLSICAVLCWQRASCHGTPKRDQLKGDR